MNRTATERADDFINNETQFHLGKLVTEQSHPRSRGLAELLAKDARAGMLMLLKIDDDLPPVLNRLIRSDAFARLADDMLATLRAGKRVYFSGCGATGRLAILLDAANRRWWASAVKALPRLANDLGDLGERTSAIMTGGDFALVRSVESFEDFISFGYRQAQEAGIARGDMLVAISEGGETSSVIGTIHAGLDTGAKVHFLFNNPADLLCDFVERSREVITDERVNVVDLTTGPMSVAGSTRMQATTMELIAAGMAYEQALGRWLADSLDATELAAVGLADVDSAATVRCVESLLGQLRSDANLDVFARYIDFEADLYSRRGRVTYFADDYLIDIFTDTTERAPTFKTPPFRSAADCDAPAPWAFVKDPLRESKDAWLNLLKHRPRCLKWTPDDYRAMNATEKIIEQPPRISEELLYTFQIGREPDPSRTETPVNAAVGVLVGSETGHVAGGDSWYNAFREATAPFARSAFLTIGPKTDGPDVFSVVVDLPKTPLDLFGHLAVKLVLNNISTATMGKIGRLASNWMAHVEASNKKLIDRSVRLIVELGHVDYRTACIGLYETLDEMETWSEERRKTVSPAAYTVEKLLR